MGEGGKKILAADDQGRRAGLAGGAGRTRSRRLATDEVKVTVVHAGVGGITESDVNLALASSAVIIGFNTRADAAARKLAESSGVDDPLLQHHLRGGRRGQGGALRHARAGAQGEVLGMVEVRQVFRISKVGTVAGCYVTEGLVKRSAQVRVLRDSVVIHTGDIDSLKRFKDDVREVKAGFECGMSLKSFSGPQGRRPVRGVRGRRGRADACA